MTNRRGFFTALSGGLALSQVRDGERSTLHIDGALFYQPSPCVEPTWPYCRTCGEALLSAVGDIDTRPQRAAVPCRCGVIHTVRFWRELL